MLNLDYYVESELHRLQNESSSPMLQHFEQWRQWQEAARIARRHAIARWAGDRLVRTGEWLRAWSAQAAAHQEQAKLASGSSTGCNG